MTNLKSGSIRNLQVHKSGVEVKKEVSYIEWYNEQVGKCMQDLDNWRMEKGLTWKQVNNILKK